MYPETTQNVSKQPFIIFVYNQTLNSYLLQCGRHLGCLQSGINLEFDPLFISASEKDEGGQAES